MESPRHQRLKQLSFAFLRVAGCAAAATEVRCPASRFRADVAGFADPLARGSDGRSGKPDRPEGFTFRVCGRATSILVECKQSRADFLWDNRRLDQLLSERRALDRQREHLEERLLRFSEPHLLGTDRMLFPELEAWDFAASRSPTYRAVLRDLRRLDQQIHGDTKFWTVARYALADIMLIAAPAGLVRVRELPPGWGLFEFPETWLEKPEDDGSTAEPMTVRLHATDLALVAARDVHRIRLLRNIAVAATCRTCVAAPRVMNIRLASSVSGGSGAIGA